MLKFVKISNYSLLPEYQEGDYVLIVKIPLFLDSVRRGDVVVFRHPLYGMMIKRVSRVAEDGKEIYVVGTHENSVDSRQFGAVRNDALIGKVIWHIARPFRDLVHSSSRGRLPVEDRRSEAVGGDLTTLLPKQLHNQVLTSRQGNLF